MPASVLGRHFALRMLPVAVGAGLVVAVVPPLAYRLVAWQRLTGQAAIYARHVARELRLVADRQPYLWRYNAGKILQATSIHEGQREVERVLVRDCAGRLIAPADAAEPARPRRLAGRAPVTSHGQLVAWVEIVMSTRDERPRLARIARASTATGLLLGLVIFLLPTRVVRRQARLLGETLDRLREADASLTAANRDLAARVAAAVQEIRELSGHLLEIQERERSRIARDVHDVVGQSLTALGLELELARCRPDQGAEHLAKAAHLCDEALRELRHVVHDLRPPELTSGALAEILRSYTERFEERTGIAASFRCPPTLTLPEPIATCLLRVLQEALTNVSRHARAQEVGVTLAVQDGSVSMEVVDDGVGADAVPSPGGTGLRAMRERCAFLGGSATVEMRPGAGTRVSVTLPLGPGQGIPPDERGTMGAS